jgi:hypothetical protein
MLISFLLSPEVTSINHLGDGFPHPHGIIVCTCVHMCGEGGRTININENILITSLWNLFFIGQSKVDTESLSLLRSHMEVTWLAHAYNPSYLRGWDPEDCGSLPALAVLRPHIQNNQCKMQNELEVWLKWFKHLLCKLKTHSSNTSLTKKRKEKRKKCQVGGVELQDLLGPFQVYIFSTDESYPCFPQAHFVLWLLLLEGRKR